MSKSKKAPTKKPGLTFEDLVRFLRELDRDLAAQAKRAVNLGVTLHNWLFGWYIEEYERHGADRAQYGERLMAKSRPPTWTGYSVPMKQKSRPSSSRNCLSGSSRARCKSASEWLDGRSRNSTR